MKITYVEYKEFNKAVYYKYWTDWKQKEINTQIFTKILIQSCIFKAILSYEWNVIK